MPATRPARARRPPPAPLARVAAPDTDVDALRSAVREFNRFYSGRIGALREGLLDSPFTLAESRVLYELAHRDAPTASELARDLGMDAGYLSRLLRGLTRRNLVARRRSERDARHTHLTLTKTGARAFAALDSRSNDDVDRTVAHLSPEERRQLLASMETIRRLLDPRIAPSERRPPIVIRAPQPGDLGWVVHRHGALYAREYGFDERFEALVAEIVSDFVKEYDPTGDRCWIAERGGEVVGSVFLVRKNKTTGKLRLLYVEPSTRGAGLGRRLVQECIRTARQLGYRTLMLWTNSVLDAARHIYEQEGFVLMHEEVHHSFGDALVGQTWEMKL